LEFVRYAETRGPWPGERIVLLNAKGGVVGRSGAPFILQRFAVAVKPHRLAIIGRPGLSSPFGLYVGEFDAAALTKVRGLAQPSTSAEAFEPSAESLSVDWAPDGNRLAYSDGTHIHVYDCEKKIDATITGGHGVRFSPAGDRLTFITDQDEGAILDLARRDTRTGLINPKHSCAIMFGQDGLPRLG